MILYSILISVTPSRVENIAKILSKQNVKQSNTADSLWGLGKHWHDARQYETRARMPRSAAKLICLISSCCADKSQTLRGNQTHSHEQMYITLHTRTFMNIYAVCSLQ